MEIKLFGGRLTVNLAFIPVVLIMCVLNGFTAVAAFGVALVLHECAHALAASSLGVHVNRLEVMPFGCTAHMESFAVVSGSKEIAMAAAGPAVNILAAAAVFAVAGAHPENRFAANFLKSNIMLAAINLLPALPMDGGRVLSALLSLIVMPLKATRLTSILGILAALTILGVGVAMVVNNALNPTMFMMGGFMLFSSARYLKNAAFTFMKQTTGKRDQIARRISVDVKAIAAHQQRTVGEVLTSLDARKYNVVHVLDDDMRVVASIDETQLIAGMLRDGAGGRLGNIKN